MTLISELVNLTNPLKKTSMFQLGMLLLEYSGSMSNMKDFALVP